MDVVVLQRLFRELEQFQRQRQIALLIQRREMCLHGLEQRIGRLLLDGIRSAGSDLNRDMDEGVIVRVVGYRPLVELDRARTDRAGLIGLLALLVLNSACRLVELTQQRRDIRRGGQIAGVLDDDMRHVYGTGKMALI